MTDTFAGFPIAGTTRHFMITYTNDGNADQIARANAVLATCEADLSSLSSWFNCNFDNSRYSIWVNIAPGVENGGASNTGYDSSQSSKVGISGTYTAAVPNANAIRDEYARMLFVAEVSEILMDFSGYGWRRGNSAGEALSRVVAALLRPAGYYRPTAGGPYVNNWLQAAGPRPDWISSSEGSDTNSISYGCGILFIYYLSTQLGFSYKQIITAGGGSLAETFSRLTGQPAANAFAGFRDLLDRHLPTGLNRGVARDNIFPLRETPSLSISPSDAVLNSRNDGLAHQIALTLGPRCEERVYTYNILDITTLIKMQAYSHGIAFPTFFWWANGVALPVHNKNTPANLPVTVTDTTPRSDDAPFATTLPINYLITDNANGSLLQMANLSTPGNIGSITVTVQAVESLVANPPQASAAQDWDFATRAYDMKWPYNEDLYNCNWHPTHEVLVSKEAMLGLVFLLKNLPDPPPDQLLQLAGAAARYQTAVNALTGGVKGLRGAVNQVMSERIDALPVPVVVEGAALQPGSLSTRLNLDTFASNAEPDSQAIPQPESPPFLGQTDTTGEMNSTG